METKVLINEVEETVQTLILGYQPENPYVSYPRTSFSLIYQNNLQMSGLLHITCVSCIFSQTSFQICAGLTHPYNYRMFPKDVEMCILTLSHQNVSKFPLDSVGRC